MSKFWKHELIQWYGAIPTGTLMALGADRVFMFASSRYGHGAGYGFLALLAAYAASAMWLGARKKAKTTQTSAVTA
jgi:hypothetical protein